MKLSGCAELALGPLTGHRFRALNLRHWKSRLNTDHTTTSRSRFSNATSASPGPRMLYLGENHQVAIFEVDALLGDPNLPISNPRGSWVLMSLRVVLHKVADLSDRSQQKLIATNDQELTGVWVEAAGTAPTQKLGAALNSLKDVEGFVYPSSKAGSLDLAIFMDKLGPESSITFKNELSRRSEALR